MWRVVHDRSGRSANAAPERSGWRTIHAPRRASRVHGAPHLGRPRGCGDQDPVVCTTRHTPAYGRPVARDAHEPRPALLPLGLPHRRGGRAVECAGLENRFGSFGPTRVRIPPSPLAVRLRAFLPRGLPEDRPPARAFRAPTSPRLPHGLPLVHPRSTRAWPRSVRRSQDRRSASSFDRNNDEIPRQYWKAPHANGRLPGRGEGVCGGLTSPQLPPAPRRARDVLARHAQRNQSPTPAHSGTRPIARRTPARGIPTRVRTNRRAAPPTGSYRARCLRISLPPRPRR